MFLRIGKTVLTTTAKKISLEVRKEAKFFRIMESFHSKSSSSLRTFQMNLKKRFVSKSFTWHV